MIPLILATIVTIIVGKCNLDPLGRGMILFLTFCITLYTVNKTTLRFFNAETTMKRFTVASTAISKNISYVYVYDERFPRRHINIRINNRLVKKDTCHIIQPLERLKPPKKRWLYLTLPYLWFDKINTWKYYPYLGKIIIYKNI